MCVIQLKLQTLYIVNEYNSISDKSINCWRRGVHLFPSTWSGVPGDIIPQNVCFHITIMPVMVHYDVPPGWIRHWMRSACRYWKYSAIRQLESLQNSQAQPVVLSKTLDFSFCCSCFWSRGKCDVREFNFFGFPCSKIWNKLNAYFTGCVTKSRLLNYLIDVK